MGKQEVTNEINQMVDVILYRCARSQGVVEDCSCTIEQYTELINLQDKLANLITDIVETSKG